MRGGKGKGAIVSGQAENGESTCSADYPCIAPG